MLQLDALVVSAAVLLIFLYLKRNSARLSSSSKLPLPPGPKGLPVIGNLLDMPTSFEWETYHKWCKELGMFNFMIRRWHLISDEEGSRHRHSLP